MTATSSLPVSVIAAPLVVSPGTKCCQIPRRRVPLNPGSVPQPPGTSLASSLMVIEVTVRYPVVQVKTCGPAGEGEPAHLPGRGTVSLLFTAIGQEITLS